MWEVRVTPAGDFDNHPLDHKLIKVEPLSAAMGAEVVGVRLPDLSDDAFEELKQALYRHKMIYLRGQHLTHAERLVLGMGQVLVAQVDHLVAVERLLQFFERLVGHVGQARADDLGAHRRRERPRLDMRVRQGMVIEISRRRDAHFPHVRLPRSPSWRSYPAPRRVHRPLSPARTRTGRRSAARCR